MEDPLRMRPDLNPTIHQLRTAAVEMTEPVVILRWDSWRFWESLAAGALTVNLDLAKYGLALPVMPQPWVHYVPLDLSDLAGSVNRLVGCRSEWGQIAEAGQRWAIEHYSPKAAAKRLVDIALRRFG